MTVICRPAPPCCSCRCATRLGVVLALFFGLAGCGEKSYKPYAGTVYPVKGQVLLPTGKPLTVGKVIFLPKQLGGMSASGELGPEGKFSLQSADSRDGAAPGEYKVRIEPPPEMNRALGKKAKPLPFPAIYAEEDGDTGLTATVKAEATDLEPFKLAVVKANKASRARD